MSSLKDLFQEPRLIEPSLVRELKAIKHKSHKPTWFGQLKKDLWDWICDHKLILFVTITFTIFIIHRYYTVKAKKEEMNKNYEIISKITIPPTPPLRLHDSTSELERNNDDVMLPAPLPLQQNYEIFDENNYNLNQVIQQPVGQRDMENSNLLNHQLQFTRPQYFV